MRSLIDKLYRKEHVEFKWWLTKLNFTFWPFYILQSLRSVVKEYTVVTFFDFIDLVQMAVGYQYSSNSTGVTIAAFAAKPRSVSYNQIFLQSQIQTRSWEIKSSIDNCFCQCQVEM